MTLKDRNSLMTHLDTPKMRATHYFTLIIRDQNSKAPNTSSLKWAIYLIPFTGYIGGIGELVPAITGHLDDAHIYISQRFGGSLKIV